MKLNELLEQKVTAQKGLLAKEPEVLTLEDAQSIKALDTEIEGLESQIKALQETETLRQKAAAREALLAQPVSRLPQPAGTAVLTPAGDAGVKAVWATCRPGTARNFQDRDGKSAAEQAYRFGMWALGHCLGRETAKRWCAEHGVAVKLHQEGLDATGGALVPDEFENTLIDLREQYGVFRRYANVKNMGSETRIVPRRTGGLTAYAMAEGATITESTKGWDDVELVARKWGVLAKMSSELGEDAVIDIGNDLAGEISYAFANKEDDCGFNGDGTSTYHGIQGIRTKIKGLSGTIANIAGLVVAAGNAYSEILLTDFESVVGKLPQYADNGRASWFVHKTFYHTVMEKLALAAGGVTSREIVSGARDFRFLGYPVVVSQVMPSVEGNSQVCALLGDLSLGCMFGDRRMTQIALSEHSDFAADKIAIRGTERFDIVAHDVGNASATAALRVPGPIVGLITAAI